MGYAQIAQAQRAFPQAVFLHDGDTPPANIFPPMQAVAKTPFKPVFVEAPVHIQPANPTQPYPNAISMLAQASCAGEDIDDQVQALAAHFQLSLTSVQYDVDELVDSLLH